MSAYILIVEDEPAIATLIRFNLEATGYRVATAERVSDAEKLLKNELPDLILMDYMLPDVSGVEYIQQLRGQTRTQNLPIIMLTARSEESDKELGLNIGADDYITKPFSPRELIARINALLRRMAPQKSKQVLEIFGIRWMQKTAKLAPPKALNCNSTQANSKSYTFSWHTPTASTAAANCST